MIAIFYIDKNPFYCEDVEEYDTLDNRLFLLGKANTIYFKEADLQFDIDYYKIDRYNTIHIKLIHKIKLEDEPFDIKYKTKENILF